MTRDDPADHGGHEGAHDHAHGDGHDDHAHDDCPDGRDNSNAEPSIYTDTVAQMRRRDYAKALATVGGITAIASLSAPLAGLQRVFQREYTGPVYGDGVPLVDGEGERITETRLSEGEQLTVFPEPRPGIGDAPTLLLRFPESAYGGSTRLEFTVSGYAAYSKVCTHAGCMVGDRQEDTLVCPCHYGKFDPRRGASVTGGPPARALPQLPITLSAEGYLVATGDFEGPIGPGGD